MGSIGGTIDVNGHNVTINTGILHDPTVAELDGGTFTSAVFTGHAGILQLATSAAANSSSIFNTSAAATNIIVTGSLTKSGTGTLTLSGSNTYTGSTTVNAGTLTLANPISLGGSALASGTSTVGSAGTFSGGALNVAQLGSLTLNGNNHFPIIVNGGTIAGSVVNVGGSATFKSSSPAIWTTPTSVLSFNGGSGTISAGGTTSSISLVRNSGVAGPMGPFLPPQSSTWLTTSGLTMVGTVDAGTLTLTPVNYVGGAGTLTPNGYTGGTTLSGLTFANPSLINATLATAAFPSLSSPGSTATLTAVPEPSGLVLGGLAAAALLFAGRMRRGRGAVI
jgi:fibronectin-binding autotransporter adhesin